MIRHSSIPAAQLSRLRLVSALATMAALAAIVADLALQFTPRHSALLSPTYQYLVGVPQWRLLLGHFLGIGAITLEISGFWVMYQLGRAAGARSALAVLLVSAYCTVVGVAFHGTFAIVALLVQAQHAASAADVAQLASTVQQVDAFVSPLAAVAAVGLATISAWYAWVVARDHTPLPRWLACCNPLAVILLCAIVAALIPSAALVLLPAAINISTAVTFGALTLALWRMAPVPAAALAPA